MSDKPPKDIWEKVGSLSGVFLSTLVAIVGLYFTNKYETVNQNRNSALDQQNIIAADNQAKLRELEAVERLLPHLSGKEADSTRQKLTLLALRELGSRDLAIQFAEILNTEGAKEALRYTVNTTKSADERNTAKKALSRLTLVTGVGGAVDSAGKSKLQQIIDIVNSLTGGTDHFFILNKSEQNFMQAMGGPESFVLEYREGSEEKHYQCENISKSLLLDAFRSYAVGNQSWKNICDWKKWTF